MSVKPRNTAETIVFRILDSNAAHTYVQCWDAPVAQVSREHYPTFRLDGKQQGAHVIVATWFHGPRPTAQHVPDHLCENKLCLNPLHLEWTTENTNRYFRARESCTRGHELSGDNLKWTREGRRRCRACTNVTARRRRAA